MEPRRQRRVDGFRTSSHEPDAFWLPREEAWWTRRGQGCTDGSPSAPVYYALTRRGRGWLGLFRLMKSPSVLKGIELMVVVLASSTIG